MTPILDHHPGVHDPASRAFGIARRVDAPITTAKYFPPGPLLDQGDTGHCGGFATANEAGASPVRVPRITNAVAHRLYYMAKDRLLDPFPREDGTTTLAMMKLGQQLSLWEAYDWAFTLPDIRRGLRLGTGLFGVTWHTGMFSPDVDGIIRATGIGEGGHLIDVNGWSPNYRRKGPHFRLWQSWGQFGKHGYLYLPEEDAGQLLVDERGEYGIPINRHLPVTPL